MSAMAEMSKAIRTVIERHSPARGLTTLSDDPRSKFVKTEAREVQSTGGEQDS